MCAMKKSDVMKQRPKYCVLCGRVNKETSLHLFPKNVSIKATWAAYCNMEVHEVKPKHYLCAKHFAPSCFNKIKNCIRLKLGSIPSVLVEKETKVQSKKQKSRNCVLCGGSLDPELRYHNFPKDILNRNKWAAFCNMEVQHVKRNHKLCHKHFDPNCFDRKKRILPNSLPSIFKVEQNLSLSAKYRYDFPKKKICMNILEDKTNSSAQSDLQTKFSSSANVSPTLVENTKNTKIRECISITDHNYSCALDLTSKKVLKADNDIVRDSIISTTPTKGLVNTATPKTCYRIRYVGDLTSVNLKEVTPKLLHKFYSLVQRKLIEKSKIARAAKQREQRMIHKLKNLQELIKQLQDKNIINTEAAAQLIQCIKCR